MIPILFSPSETNFTTNGIGRLTGVTSCVVTEERNEGYELEMEIAISSPFFGSIKLGSLIGVKPCRNGTIQAFEVYEIEKRVDNTASIRAMHISYRTMYIPIKPFSATGIQNVINSLKNNCAVTSKFNVTTDLTDTSKKFSISVPQTMRYCLSGDEDESLVSIFDGEMLYDNFNIKILKARGSDTGVELRRGKNVTDLTVTTNTEDMITGILPYWADNNDSNVVIGDIQYTSTHSDWANEQIIPCDLSNQFDSKPSVSSLNSKAKEYLEKEDNKDVIKPEETIELSFVDLTHTEDYKDIAPLEAVSLCDTVRVVYPQLGVSYKTKVTYLEWDVLAEETVSIKLGDPEKSIINTIVDNTSTVGYITGETQKISNKVVEVEETVGDAVVKIGDVEVKLEDTQVTIQDINGDVTDLEGRVSANEETVKQVNSYFTFKNTGLEIATDGSTVKTVYSADGFSIVDSNTEVTLAKATSGQFNCINGLGVNDWAIEQNDNSLNIFRKR